jgi:hypothetical protein
LLELRFGIDPRFRRRKTGHGGRRVIDQPLDAHELPPAVGQLVVERAGVPAQETVAGVARRLLVRRAAPIGGKCGYVRCETAARNRRCNDRVHMLFPARRMIDGDTINVAGSH